MSFYRRQRPQMGFVWLAPVLQLVGGAMQSHPVGAGSIPQEQSNPIVPIALAVGGVALVGGILYFAWKS